MVSPGSSPGDHQRGVTVGRRPLHQGAVATRRLRHHPADAVATAASARWSINPKPEFRYHRVSRVGSIKLSAVSPFKRSASIVGTTQRPFSSMTCCPFSSSRYRYSARCRFEERLQPQMHRGWPKFQQQLGPHQCHATDIREIGPVEGLIDHGDCASVHR